MGSSKWREATVMGLLMRLLFLFISGRHLETDTSWFKITQKFLFQHWCRPRCLHRLRVKVILYPIRHRHLSPVLTVRFNIHTLVISFKLETIFVFLVRFLEFGFQINWFERNSVHHHVPVWQFPSRVLCNNIEEIYLARSCHCLFQVLSFPFNHFWLFWNCDFKFLVFFVNPASFKLRLNKPYALVRCDSVEQVLAKLVHFTKRVCSSWSHTRPLVAPYSA